MDKKTINDIDNILTTYNKKLNKKMTNEWAKKTEHEQALGAFRAVISSIIKPQMTIIGNHLKSKGIGFYIKMFEEGYNDDGTQYSPEDICFMMFKNTGDHFKGDGYKGEWPKDPHASFMLDSCTNKIIAVESKREVEVYAINEITNEIVDKHVVRVLAGMHNY